MAGVCCFRPAIRIHCFCPAVPPKTFAQGWATALAMDRPDDDLGVIVERADNGMLIEKRQRLLRRGVARQ